jgi:hypothetical protein
MIKLERISSTPAGYGHRKIEATLSHNGREKTFTMVTDKMPQYEKAMDLEGEERDQALFDLIYREIEGEVSDWFVIYKYNLRDALYEAVQELEGAPDRHNTNGFKVKVCLNPEGELYHKVEHQNSFTNGVDTIVSFEYSRPDYDTEQSLLDEFEYEGTIEEWDWEAFNFSPDIYNYIETLLEQAVENCKDLNLEVV